MKDTLEVVPFLSMNGNAKEAIAFYEKHLLAKRLMYVTYKMMALRDSSIVLTPVNKDWVAHCVLKIGNSKLMIAEDGMNPEIAYAKGNHVSLCIQSSNKQQIEQFYESLIGDDNVHIVVPLSKNVFSEAYGIVEDPFGMCIQLMYDQRLECER